MAPDRILPDTCAWIDFFKGSRTPLAEVLVRSLTQQEVVTCGIVLCELLQGVKKPGEELLMQNALQALPHLEMTRELWLSAGRLSASLRKSGHTLPLSDIIIATIAMNHGYAVLTVDRHFAAVPGLVIVSGLQAE
ncbi:MAG: PIN domain-containing protein [Desulfuromonadaceae bacterium]|nr:PIN domain-containing protein [Desulfuromonadaceae bacterium]